MGRRGGRGGWSPLLAIGEKSKLLISLVGAASSLGGRRLDPLLPGVSLRRALVGPVGQPAGSPTPAAESPPERIFSPSERTKYLIGRSHRFFWHQMFNLETHSNYRLILIQDSSVFNVGSNLWMVAECSFYGHVLSEKFGLKFYFIFPFSS